MIEVFGIAFSIMGLLPSIASTLSYSIPAGPAGMVWVSNQSLCNICTMRWGYAERRNGAGSSLPDASLLWDSRW